MGYRFNKWVALEVGYINLGEAFYDAESSINEAGVPTNVLIGIDDHVRYSSHGPRISVLGMFAIGERFDIHARGGLYRADTRIREKAIATDPVTLEQEQFFHAEEKASSNDFFVGAGAILGALSPLPHVTSDAWDAVIDINLTANWRLIRTLDPILKRSDAARVLFATAGEASGELAYWGPYAVSKAGLETLARTYAVEVKNTDIRVTLLDPGLVPVIHLHAEKHADHDDQEIDADGRPVLDAQVLYDAAQEHRLAPQRRTVAPTLGRCTTKRWRSRRQGLTVARRNLRL